MLDIFRARLSIARILFWPSAEGDELMLSTAPVSLGRDPLYLPTSRAPRSSIYKRVLYLLFKPTLLSSSHPTCPSVMDTQASRRYRQGIVSKCDGRLLYVSSRLRVHRATTAELTLNASPTTAECVEAINVSIHTYGLLALSRM
jgi:hypothetical protein